MRITNRSGVITVNEGVVLFCCWDDCEVASRQGHDAQIMSNGRQVTYTFCTERHRNYFTNSYCTPAATGNLPSGSRSPLGLWTP